MDAGLSRNMPYTEYDTSVKPIPSWVYAIILFVVPLTGVLVYFFFSCIQRRRAGSSPSNPTVATSAPVPDVENQIHHKARPSFGKWSLSIPKWTRPSRRGSDGGFPPETRHIAFPDPGCTLSTDSLDAKPPGLRVISPVTLGYPKPPPPVASRPAKGY